MTPVGSDQAVMLQAVRRCNLTGLALQLQT
jgi:hypothetical protein